jgi:hypothetical protein
MNRNLMWSIPADVSIITNVNKISTHNQHTFMNIFIKGRLISIRSLGHHQAIIRESEYIQKLEIIKRNISPFTSRYIKNICQDCSVKKYRKYRVLQKRGKMTVLLPNGFENSYLKYQLQEFQKVTVCRTSTVQFLNTYIEMTIYLCNARHRHFMIGPNLCAYTQTHARTHTRIWKNFISSPTQFFCQ